MTLEEAVDKALAAIDKAAGLKDGAEELCTELEAAIKGLASTGTDAQVEAAIAQWADLVKRIRKAIEVLDCP